MAVPMGGPTPNDSNLRYIDCVEWPPRAQPQTAKIRIVKSRLRFVQFGFAPRFGSISSISIKDGFLARHDEIGSIVSPSSIQS